MAVAVVGNGTVRLVPPVIAVARAWARTVLPRVKFTTGRPKPWFTKPLPATVKLVGGAERSTVLGVMLLTPETIRVSVIVNGTLPISVYVTFPVCTYTWACTLPAERPGRFGAMAVAVVGNGTVRLVLPVIALARAWAISMPFRVKFATGRPKPRFAKPVPVMVKLAGGATTSTVLGVMLLTPGTVPVTRRWRPPPLDVKLTFEEITPEVVGVNRTTTVCVAPRVRLKEPPERMLNGGAAATVPVSVPPPVFWTTKL